MSPPPTLETLPSEVRSLLFFACFLRSEAHRRKLTSTLLPPSLPQLILHTLSFLPLDAIASFSQTSVFLSQLVYGNGNDGSLWRTLYLSSFDDPSISAWDLRPPPSKDGSARSKRLALEKEDRRYQWREGARQSVTALREWKAGRMDLVRSEVRS